MEFKKNKFDVSDEVIMYLKNNDFTEINTSYPYKYFKFELLSNIHFTCDININTIIIRDSDYDILTVDLNIENLTKLNEFYSKILEMENKW